MSLSSVAINFNKTLDVERNITTKVTFYCVFVLNYLTELCNIVLGKILYTGIGVDAGLLEYFVGAASAYTIDIAKTDLYTLCVGQIYAGNTSHIYTSLLALLLLVLGIFADYHDFTFSLDNLALLAYFLYGRFHFHIITASISVSIVYLER